MLALAGGRQPLINPAVFNYADGSIWMTTSRFAAKIGIARRNPKASFLVAGDDRSVLFQGLLEVYDLRSVAGGVRALLGGPALALGMAGYAAKNSAFIGGYLVDIAGIPAEWWPHNRVVMRLRPRRVRTMRLEPVAPRRRSPIPLVPRAVSSAVSGMATGYLAWAQPDGHTNMAPVMWAIDGRDGLAWLPGALGGPQAATPAALVIEYHHPFRARRMIGACLRGEIAPDPAAVAPIADRYRVDIQGGTPLRLITRRATYWQGFEVATRAVPQREAQRAERS